MKNPLFHLVAVGAFVLGLTFVGTALAQDAPDSSNPPPEGGPPPGPGDREHMLSFLSPEDRAKLMKARDEVLSTHPELKEEEESLKQKRDEMKDGSPEDRKALFQEFMAHEKKMRAAMLQVDPSLQPIFDQIDQHMKERFKEHGGGPPPPPPGN